MPKIDIERDEFEGNIKITISKNEVRLWVCKDGISVFRFKALGKVYKSNDSIVILGGIKDA